MEESTERQANLDGELLKMRNQLNEMLMLNYQLEKENKDFSTSNKKVINFDCIKKFFLKSNYKGRGIWQNN